VDEELKNKLRDAAINETLGKPTNPASLDIAAQAAHTAKIYKTLYDAFIEEGFTEDEAFCLLLNMMSPPR